MADTNFKRFTPGIQLVPQGTSNVSQQGDLDVDSVSTKINYHNGTISSPLVTEAGTATLSNKTLNNTNIVTIQDTNLTIQDDGDNTKQFKFQASGITTGTLRTIVIPDATTTLVGTDTTQTIMNKTIDNSNTITIKDVNFTIQDDGDTTKQAKFQASGISTGTTRTFVFPDATTTLVGTDATQTLTNKTISGSTNTITNVSLTTGVTGTLPIANGGTNATTKAAAFDSLSPMTTGGDIIYGGASGTGTRLANGSSGQVLTSNGGTTAPSWTTAPFPALVGVKYNTTNTQSFANNTEVVLNFGSSVFDTGSFVSTPTTNWTFTAPTGSAYFAVSVTWTFTSGGTNNTDREGNLTVNGSRVLGSVTLSPNGSTTFQQNMQTVLLLNGGDTIQFKATQASGGSLNLSGNAAFNEICITKIGT